jgi:hypothetical protein
MADFPRYEPASGRDAKKAQPGVVAFMAVVGELFGASNMGIYNFRKVRGSSAPSVHGEGRAGDAGFPLVNGRANPKGWRLLEALLPNVRALGIQLIIWDQRIWSAKAPTGARYTGTVPHYDHLHIEFTWDAARSLTRDLVRSVLAGRPTPAAPPAQAAKPSPGPTAIDLLAIQQLLQEDDDMIVIRTGKGIAHLVNNRAVGLNVAQLVKVREAYRKANRPLVELTLDTDEQWRWYTGLG